MKNGTEGWLITLLPRVPLQLGIQAELIKVQYSLSLSLSLSLPPIFQVSRSRRIPKHLSISLRSISQAKK